MFAIPQLYTSLRSRTARQRVITRPAVQMEGRSRIGLFRAFMRSALDILSVEGCRIWTIIAGPMVPWCSPYPSLLRPLIHPLSMPDHPYLPSGVYPTTLLLTLVFTARRYSPLPHSQDWIVLLR